MNDYLGGRAVALDHDDEGRVVRQAERNLYLPQPNYVALWGGLPIDVGKIEVAHHRTDSCSLYWKTITSANDSAVADDGKVSFERSALGTTVVILGRQQFVLPRALHFVEQRLDPTLRDRLVTHAYATFFSRTIANFEALVEGRDIRIGRGATRADDPSAGEPMPSAALEKLVDDLVDWMGNLGGDVGVEVERGLVIDSDGFTHVPGTSPEPLVATVLGAAP